MSLISLHQITKSYLMGDIQQTVLKGIDLSIEQGEMVAIMGASGSGKSTLMNIIGLLDTQSTGDYQFDTTSVASFSDDERAGMRNHAFGFVFQQFYLLSRLSALQNVMLPLQYREPEVIDAEVKAKKLLEHVGMLDKIHHRPNELSGGQQQRVAIARALICDPKIVLADEPTGALDSKTGEDILNIFIDLNKNQGTTIVIITHDEKVAKHCHRIIKIADGMLV